jgi:hypothetical protein
VSELALVVLAEMRDNALKAIEYSERGGARWEEDGLVVDAVANRVRQVTELAKYSFPEDEKNEYRTNSLGRTSTSSRLLHAPYRDLNIELLRATVERELRELVRVLSALDLPEFADS